VHCESRIAIAVARGQFGKSGRETSAVGIRYQKTGDGQQTEKTQCVYSELSNVINAARPSIIIKHCECPIKNPKKTSLYKLHHPKVITILCVLRDSQVNERK
jgi:hypothetical protein